MPTARDVLVIDEAGMVGTQQLERALSHAAEAGAKVVLISRRMAREDFAKAMRAANDNAPESGDEQEPS